jgi:5-methylcytosine-specific restriction protein A
VCGFDFEGAYGIIGRGFVHVHHLAPLATAAEQRDIDPIQDLRPVCPNCHAMLHRRTPPFSVTELQRIRKGFPDVPLAEKPERDAPVV